VLTDAGGKIVLMGDSVSIRVAKQDTDRRSLYDMLAAELSAHAEVIQFTRSAWHLGVFARLFTGFIQVGAPHPLLVIYPINVRQFSPQWYSDPRWDYTGRKSDLAVFKAAARLPVSYPDSPITELGQFWKVALSKPDSEEGRLARLNCLATFHYGHPLVATHERLRDLLAVVRLSRYWMVRSLGYLVPVNRECVLEHGGANVAAILAANIATVKRKVAAFLAHDTVLLDTSNLIGRDGFFSPNEVTEHLNQDGRVVLAAAILAASKSLLAGRWVGEED
jgi:hypothetical protein